MTTTVIRLPFAAPAPTRYSLIPRLAGFPSTGLAALYRFTEANLTTGLLDDVSQSRFATSGTAVGGIHTEAMMSGGGIKLTGLRALIGPNVDISQPWTLILAATMPLPTGAVSQGMLGMGNYSSAGWTTWYQMLSQASAGQAFGNYVRKTIDGAAEAGLPQLPAPFVAVFDGLHFLVARHSGSGAIQIEQRRGGAVSRYTTTWDMTAIQGPAGSKTAQQPVKMGGAFAGLGNAQGGIYDAFAAYTKSLSEAEVQAWIDAAAALALTRGRS
jgi:hypothetical protein